MIRIIAGAAGGRRLTVPSAATRPTSERAREGLFSALEALRGPLAGARFLDLYAGSGAVGLEAASRGASRVLLVEAHPRAAQVLRRNVDAVGLPGVDVRVERAERLARAPAPQPYDVVFADPPYSVAAHVLAGMLADLVRHGWLAPGAVVVVERATRAAPWSWPAPLVPERCRRYGEGTLWYGRAARRKGPDERGPTKGTRTGGARTSSSATRRPLVRRCVCPGSFDPVTNGHLDIIGRSSALYDEVTVAVLVNKAKSGLFTVEERIELLRETTAVYHNVVIAAFDGLLVDFCREHDIPVIIKGLRAVSDFDYELQMAQMNHSLAGVETLFIATNPEYSFLSSSLVKEVAMFGGDVSHLLPSPVLPQLVDRLARD